MTENENGLLKAQIDEIKSRIRVNDAIEKREEAQAELLRAQAEAVRNQAA